MRLVGFLLFAALVMLAGYSLSEMKKAQAENESLKQQVTLMQKDLDQAKEALKRSQTQAFETRPNALTPRPAPGAAPAASRPTQLSSGDWMRDPSKSLSPLDDKPQGAGRH